MKMEFVSTVMLNDEGPFSTFLEAFRNWFPRFKEVWGNPFAPSSSWIQGTFTDDDGVEVRMPLYVSSMGDLVKEAGLIDEDENLTDVETVDEELVKKTFFDYLQSDNGQFTVKTAECEVIGGPLL